MRYLITSLFILCLCHVSDEYPEGAPSCSSRLVDSKIKRMKWPFIIDNTHLQTRSWSQEGESEPECGEDRPEEVESVSTRGAQGAAAQSRGGGGALVGSCAWLQGEGEVGDTNTRLYKY